MEDNAEPDHAAEEDPLPAARTDSTTMEESKEEEDLNPVPSLLAQPSAGEDEEEDLDAMLANLGAYQKHTNKSIPDMLLDMRYASCRKVACVAYC